MSSAGNVPMNAKELRAFVDQTMKESGISIEYGCKSLERDDWAIDCLTDPAYALRLKKVYDT